MLKLFDMLDEYSSPKISLIAQISQNRVLARNGKVPFKLPTDFKRYMDKLTGRVVIAGRRSYNSKAKSKLTIVVSRDPEFHLNFPHMIVMDSLDKALEKAKEIEKEEIMVVGGGQLFEQTIGIADKLYLTVVHEIITGEVYFPDYSAFTKVLFREDHEENDLKFTFLDLERT